MQVGDTALSPEPAPEVSNSSPADLLERAHSLLAAAENLSAADWDSLSGDRSSNVLDVLEQAERGLAAVRAVVTSRIEADGLWALDGQRTLQTWVRDRTGTTGAAAGRQVRTARALRDHLPLTGRALADGRIGGEQVGILVRGAITTTKLQTQLHDPELGEAFLVENAQLMSADQFAQLVKSWAIMADPEAADRNWREDDAREELTVARTTGGYHVGGWLGDVSGQALTQALRAHMGVKDTDDTRTPAQRRAAALVSLAHQSLDAGQQLPHARIRPHLTITTTLATLRALAAATGSVIPPDETTPAGTARGTTGPTAGPAGKGSAFGPHADKQIAGGPLANEPGAGEPLMGEPTAGPAVGTSLFELTPEARTWMQAWQPGDDHVISTTTDPDIMTGMEPATLEDGTPIPHALLARLACDSAMSRVIFGPDSTVLDVGREQRIFPAHMVKAIHARDRHCQYPRCDEPPGFGELHHSLQWYRDTGPTAVEHGILLCWHHHDLVHTRNITITHTHGTWQFHDQHNRHIGTSGSHPSSGSTRTTDSTIEPADADTAAATTTNPAD